MDPFQVEGSNRSEQLRDFFGLGDSQLPERLDEEQLLALYRAKLKELCGIPHAAELARVAWTLRDQGEIVVVNTKPRERTMKDDHQLRRK